MKEKPKKEKIFDNLFNMTYEPVIVDKKPNPLLKKCYATIFNALNNAEEHIMIKINPGIYNERIQIKKKDLKIQAAQISQNSILINQEHPNIIIDLPESTDKVFFESLKMVNICENNAKHEVVNGSYESIKKEDYLNFKINPAMNTCIYIKKGIVQMDECKISLAAYHNKHATLPCIVVEKEGCLIMNRSEIRGGGGTVGIFSKGGKVIIKESLLRDHGVAGILFSQRQQSLNLTVKNCIFIKCNESLVLNGPFEATIQNNSFTESSESGIVIYNGNRSKITNNEIQHCKVGVYIKNSYASVMKNTISNSNQWGFKLKSSRGLLCKPTLKFNVINQNTEGGILVEGSLNGANILNNELKFNNHYGIKVINRASPHIFMNKIVNTLGNGVHVSCHCSAFIEKNQIQGSLKCNLVLQGPNNIDTFVFRNTITKARGQGIFCIFGEKFTIKDNDIKENYNGIVSLTGVQSIEDNTISENQRNGILLIRDNNVAISGNEIENNKKAGIFIRDSSVGRVEENSFSRNRTEIVIENDDSSFSQIENTNKFQEGYDIRIPKNYKCQLI